MNALIDIRAVLPSVRVPTLVIHRTGPGLEDVQARGRYVAERIPGARLVELPGVDYLPWIGDPDAVLDEIETFVTGARPAHRPRHTVATVLVAEVEHPARHAAVLASRRWVDVQERFEAMARRELEAAGGRFVSLMGDRLVALFDQPLDAIASAENVREAAAELGLATRAGIHTGECEIDSERVAGVAVTLASWVATQSSGEILCSRTVRDLAMGSALEFSDRGSRSFDGRTGWQLFAVAPRPLVADAVPQRAPAALPMALTPREREVFGLLVRGMTNRQIAQALHIGERTAESHVANILAKSGLSNRTQLAAATSEPTAEH
jgi:DNA-binding NarL/FixJ family response regulator